MTKRKRIAVLLTGGDINNRKGLMSACLSRARYLKKYATEYDVDVFTLQEEYREFLPHNLFFRDGCFESVEIDGMQIHVLWKLVYRAKRFYRAALRKYYERTKTDFLDLGWQHRYVDVFKNYDMLSVHSFNGGLIALMVKEKYGIPYFVTWHGSDIHTHPWERPWVKQPTIEVIQHAEGNFFVSRALLDKSEELTTSACKQVLYNGIDTSVFYRFSEKERRCLREKYGVSGEKVVAFAGSLFPIKNADLLPEIFAEVRSRYPSPVQFWIIGDGVLRPNIEKRLSDLSIDCKLWGNQPVDIMPEMYNCSDVLVLPSKNEGLPLVVIEAAACGASVVGSRVGGIPEAIGAASTVGISEDFTSRIGELIVQKLAAEASQIPLGDFTWDNTAARENNIYSSFFGRK